MTTLILKAVGMRMSLILFSLRPYDHEKAIYEILDENHEVIATMTFDAMKDLYQQGIAA